MNDDELRKILLNFEATGIANRDGATGAPTPGSGTVRLLTILAIVFGTIGILSLASIVGHMQLDLFQRAERQRPPQMDDVIVGAIALALSIVPLIIAAILTVARTLMVRVVKLRKVNAAWLEIFKQMQVDQKKVAE
jgi:hypothetical protein